MAQSQALQPQEKQEVVSRDETTVPVRYFVPTTDILETEDALTVVMEVPGVDRQAIDIGVENDVLKVGDRGAQQVVALLAGRIAARISASVLAEVSSLRRTRSRRTARRSGCSP